MLIAIVSLLTLGLVGFVVLKQNKLDLSFDLAEPQKLSSQISLTKAVRGTLAHIECGKVEDVYYGVGTFGISASRTKIRRQLRALREAGKVAMTFSNGRGSYSLPA